MSAILASMLTGLLGLAVGAALQRWGDAERKLHGHKTVPMVRATQVTLHRTVSDQWRGW